MQNAHEARYNMLSQQMMAGKVLDEHILNIVAQLPREDFVPALYQRVAYADTTIPLGNGQAMLSPWEIGKILEALDIQAHEKVLEIGTATGYLTGLLAKQAQHVYSVDGDESAPILAAKKLARHGIHNITFSTGNLKEGWTAQGPYDVIVINGGINKLPETLKNQLKANGRIFAILGEAPAMHATLISKENKHWQLAKVFETVVPYVINTTAHKPFTL